VYLKIKKKERKKPHKHHLSQNKTKLFRESIMIIKKKKILNTAISVTLAGILILCNMWGL